MAKIEEPSVRERCEADFNWLLTQAEPALFGLDYNPLSHFRRPPTLVRRGAAQHSLSPNLLFLLPGH